MLNCKGYWRCKILTWIGCCPCWYLLSRDKGCTHSCLDWIALTSVRCWSVAVAVAELEALATSCERFALGPISPVGPSNQPAWKVIIDYQNFTIWILLGKQVSIKFMVASLLLYLHTCRHIGTLPSLSWVRSLLETKDVSWGLLLGVGTAIFDTWIICLQKPWGDHHTIQYCHFGSSLGI